MANIAIINLLRALTAFASATTAVVNDNTDDGVPEIFGYDLLESTTMDGSNAVGGHKNLLIFDANSYLICDRIGTTVIYEPLVPGTGGINPAGVVQGSFAPRSSSRRLAEGSLTMKPFIVRIGTLAAAGTLAGGLALAASGTAFAATPSTGQPGASCQAEPSSPGNAASAPGSAFNEPSPAFPNGGVAGQVYAGNGVSAGTANSTAAVSQYDVACLQVSQH